MKRWQVHFLGTKKLPEDISAFEIAHFFSFDKETRQAIRAKRNDCQRLGLAVHIGFLRMTGCSLDAFEKLPRALLKHLGKHLGIVTPDLFAPHHRVAGNLTVKLRNHDFARVSAATEQNIRNVLSNNRFAVRIPRIDPDLEVLQLNHAGPETHIVSVWIVISNDQHTITNSRSSSRITTSSIEDKGSTSARDFFCFFNTLLISGSLFFAARSSLGIGWSRDLHSNNAWDIAMSAYFHVGFFVRPRT